VVDLFADASPRAEQAQTHSNGRNTQAVGHFLRGIVQDILQQADLPQIRWKLRDGFR
jgi:hypothetical protein